MTFNPFESDLPITEVIPEVQQKLQANNTLIVNAPPGAGKSTLLPLALLDSPWLEGKKIIMLEPRRLAAKSIANRMADLLNEKAGQRIGYRIRFENKTSEQTQIEVVTEGILTRMLQSDNAIEDIGLVIFDEFHERSIHADVALALCRESQSILRSDLRIMIMSATLDMQQLPQLLNAPVVISQGRQYPVDIHHLDGSDDWRLLPELTARTIIDAIEKHSGDVLVFLPGQGEIKKCEEILRGQLQKVVIHPLYGQLPPGKQQAAILPDQHGRRKVVLATSIAETSLTIEGVKIVVDSGFGRTLKFDPNSGLSRLETIQIAKDSADQRAGRAGRLSHGVCYRMWSKATDDRRASHRTPEILEADLASLVLDMSQWGINDIQQMTWLTPPSTGMLAQATDTLHQLDALENDAITAHGKKMHQLPCHPRIAHMLLMAKENDELALATDIAAILEERDPLPRDTGIDINLRIEALRRFRKENLDGRKMANIEKVAASYRKLFHISVDNSYVDPYEAGLLLAYAYPERIAFARPGNNAQFQLANGRYAVAGHKDDLAWEPWLAVAHIDARDGLGKIFMAAPLNPKDLAPMVKEQEIITWDTKKGGLIASKDLRIGNIVLQSTPLPDPDESQLTGAISNAIKKEGQHLLDFSKEVTQWQNRILSLRKWQPEANWPDVSTTTLLANNDKWLTPYLNSVKKPEDLKKIDLLSALHHHLDWELQKALDELAPTRIEVPSGSNVKIEYHANGEPPVLAVRLQEMFGLAETPTIVNGQVSLLLHLLSPGFKPVQITQDLKSFWNNAYYEVRKDLKRRYPKHSWPDDPWSAEAVRGVRRRK